MADDRERQRIRLRLVAEYIKQIEDEMKIDCTRYFELLAMHCDLSEQEEQIARELRGTH